MVSLVQFCTYGPALSDDRLPAVDILECNGGRSASCKAVSSRITKCESYPDINMLVTARMKVGKNPFKCENDSGQQAKNYDKTVDTCVKACL